MSAFLAEKVAELAARCSALEKRLEQSSRMGPCAEVDAARGMMRLEVGRGADGTAQLSPWVPYAQFAGALKVHTPPSVGQTFALMSPGGDFEQGFAVPLSWSNANPSPSDKGDENVMKFGAATIALRGDELTIDIPRLLVTAGGVEFELTPDGLRLLGDMRVTGDFDAVGGSRFTGGIEAIGGSVTHDGRNIGSDHRHVGVRSGGDTTGIPQG